MARGPVERWSDNAAYRRAVARRPVRSILVCKLDHVGDFVLALDAMLALRQAFPQARIELACAPWNVELAHALGLFDEVHPVQFFNPRADGKHPPFDPLSVICLAQRVYDIAIDLRVDPDTRVVLRHVFASFKAGFEDANHNEILDLSLPHRAPGVNHVNIGLHQTFLMQRLVRSVADVVHRTDAVHGLLADRVAQPADIDLSAARGRTLVVCNTSSGRLAKNWPLAYFRRLVNWLVHEMEAVVLLLGSKDQLADAQSIAAACASPDVLSAVGRTTLRQAVDLVRQASLYVGNDSGLTHIAARLDIPVVALFSGIDPPAMWAPLGERVTVLRAPVACSPCHISSIADCRGELACTAGISEAIVRAALRVHLVAARPFAADPAREGGRAEGGRAEGGRVGVELADASG